jgi:hypothetical protein
MTTVIRRYPNDVQRILDNEDLYGILGSDLEGLFLRMPLLPDADGYPACEGEDDNKVELFGEPPEDETMLPLYNAMIKETLVIYVLDEEALQKKMVKLKWFDIGGNSVWWNWIEPWDTVNFEAHTKGLGHRLDYVYELSEEMPLLREQGAIIQYE